MANTVQVVVTAKDEASKVLDSLGGSLDRASSRASGFSQSLGRIRDVALGVYLPQLASKIADVGTSAFTSAGDFEQALNVFRSVSGATAEQMSMVSDRARQLGKDVSLPGISAKDAALAMLELSKAGIAVNDTLAASKGVLSLAKAGQMGTAEAAEIAANALNAFRLSGDKAGQVADVLAAAANASSAGVHDMAFSLQMASASASAMKVPLEDTVALLSAMANNGLKGSDAGTSLKTFMMAFTPTSENAAAAMKKLNLQFYDAKGNFVGMREVVRQLQEGTKNLTDEQKSLYLETAFGSDAVRAANILVKEGVAGYDKMSAAVRRTGAATELAAAQNAGWNGALDNLRSTLETIGIEVGMKLIPSLTRLATAVSNNLQKGFEDAKIVVRLFFDLLRGGDPTIRSGEERMAGLARALSLVRDAVSQWLMPSLTALWRTISENLAPALARLLPYVDDVAKILGGLLVGALWVVTNALNGVIQAISFGINAALAFKTAIVTAIEFVVEKAVWFKDNWLSVLGTVVGFLATLPIKLPLLIGQAVAGMVAKIVNTDWSAVWEHLWNGALRAFDRIKNGWLDVWNFLKNVKWQDVFTGVAKSLGNALVDMINGAIRGAFSGVPVLKDHIPQIPRFEKGVRNFGGGLAVVGDVNGRGGELIDLPRGASVYSNSESKEMLRNMGTTIYQTNNIYNQVDLDSANRELGFRLVGA